MKMISMFVFGLALAFPLVSSATTTCATGVVTAMTTGINEDSYNGFSVVIGGKTYAAQTGQDANETSGQANLSLLMQAFATGNTVTLTDANNGCTASTPRFTTVYVTK